MEVVFEFKGTEKQKKYANSIARRVLASCDESIEMWREGIDDCDKESDFFKKACVIYSDWLKAKELIVEFYKHASAGEVIDIYGVNAEEVYGMVKKTIDKSKLTYKHLYDKYVRWYGLEGSKTVK